MHQRRSRDTTRLLVIRQGNIIRDDNHLHLQAVAFGFFRRQAKVKPVAGVVFHNQQAATIARHRHNGIEDRIHAWGGEQIATHRCGKHAFTDEPGMCRFMAGAATGDHRHAAFIPVAACHHADGRIDIQFDEITVRRGEKYAFNGIVDKLFAVVKKESGHSFPKFCLPYAKA